MQSLHSIRQGIGKYRWPNHVSGTYVRYACRTYWDCFCVNEAGLRNIEFCLLANRIGAAWRKYGPGSIGDIEGKSIVDSHGKAEYQENSEDFPTCHVTMRFKEGTLELKQEGDCGFGYGVDANGTYERITSDNAPLDRCSAE